MCLLIFKPANKVLPYEHLVNGSRINCHGSGCAIADGKKLVIYKDAKYGAADIAAQLDRFKGHPAIVHFRYATHGSKNHSNTHPFPVGDNWVAAHNGVIAKITTEKDESDSRAFLRQHAYPLVKSGASLADKDITDLLGKEMGLHNKMAFLSTSGEFGIANEKQGGWDEGIWYSNNGYKPAVYTHTSTVYGSSWDAEDSTQWHSASRKQKHHSATTSECCTVAKEQKSRWVHFNPSITMCDFCHTDLGRNRMFFDKNSEMILCEDCYNNS